jgi:hypothetical protein
MSAPAVPRAALPPDPIQVGSFFLETLTTGMYEDPFHCIREYIQNGFDAIRAGVRGGILKEDDGHILISLGGSARAPSLNIRDNGTGIPTANAYSTLVSLGASRKTPAHDAGFRGIGRLGGIAYCTKLRFTTKAQGEPVATVVEWDCGLVRSYFSPGAEPVDVREVVRNSVKTKSVPETETEHYTQVEMIHLVNLGEEFVDPDKLLPYLRQVCPVEYPDTFDYAEQVRTLATAYGERLPVVNVDLRQRKERISIHKPYKNSYPTSRPNSPSTLHSIETITRKDHGWFGWIGVSKFPGEIVDETAAGVRFRVKNIQIGGSDIIEALAAELTSAGSERRLQRWAIGEIFITSTEVVPNARRDGFEDSTAWRAIQRDISEQVVKRIIKLIRSASSTRSGMRALATALTRLVAALVRESIATAEKNLLEAEIRKNLDTLNRADTKLPGADPKEVAILTSKFKELGEALNRLQVVDPEPEPDAEGDEAQDDEGSGVEDEDETGDGSTSEGESGRTGVMFGDTRTLEVVQQVLAEELGEAEARRLLALITRRLTR